MSNEITAGSSRVARRDLLFRVFVTGVLVVLSRTCLGDPADTAEPSTSAAEEEISNAWRIVDERTFGLYRVRVSERRRYREMRVLVERNEEECVVWETQGGIFTIADVSGRDVSGDGTPDLVLLDHSGFHHCCLTIHVFGLGESFEHITRFEAGLGSSAEWEDVNGDGRPELIEHDDTFAYWNACYAESPRPRLVYEFKDTGFSLAPELMAEPAPGVGVLLDKAESVRQDRVWSLGDEAPELWGQILDLLFTGYGNEKAHAERARAFLDLAWGGRERQRGTFIRAFCVILEASPYAPYLDIKLTEKSCAISGVPFLDAEEDAPIAVRDSPSLNAAVREAAHDGNAALVWEKLGYRDVLLGDNQTPTAVRLSDSRPTVLMLRFDEPGNRNKAWLVIWFDGNGRFICRRWLSTSEPPKMLGQQNANEGLSYRRWVAGEENKLVGWYLLAGPRAEGCEGWSRAKLLFGPGIEQGRDRRYVASKVVEELCGASDDSDGGYWPTVEFDVTYTAFLNDYSQILVRREGSTRGTTEPRSSGGKDGCQWSMKVNELWRVDEHNKRIAPLF